MNQPYIGKDYKDMTPAEKRAMDRATQRGGENEARGSEDAMKARGLKPIVTKRGEKRGSAKRMER